MFVFVTGAKAKLMKAHQDERLLQFLMGLNESFIRVRSNILLSSPLPSIGQAYSLVIQDEKQREINTSPVYLGDSTSFIVVNQSYGNRNYPSFKPQKETLESNKNSNTYAYCKKPGHNIDKCYRIHGFPADFKFTKKRRFQTLANNAHHAVEEVDQAGNGFSNAKTLTQKNIGELLQLLQQFKLVQQSDKNAEATTSANCAGMKRFFNSYVFLVKIDANSWILDSGAS